MHIRKNMFHLLSLFFAFYTSFYDLLRTCAPLEKKNFNKNVGPWKYIYDMLYKYSNQTLEIPE